MFWPNIPQNMQKDRKHFKPKMFVLIKDVLDYDFVGNSLIQAQTLNYRE